MTKTNDLTALAIRLVGPDGVDSFDAKIRERRAQAFCGVLDPEAVGGLMCLSELEKLLDGPDAPLDRTDVFHGGHILRLMDIHHRSNRRVSDVSAEYIAKGATLRVRDIERSSSVLAAFTGAVSRVYAAKSQINLYLTPPATAGFPPHFDNTDVFILQVAGSKKWSLHPEYSHRVPLPAPDVAWDPERFQPLGAAETHIMKVGDVLYLPRGAMHSAVCTEEESLHLTISLVPLTVAELLQREVDRLSRVEPGLRERVVWSVDGGETEAEDLRDTMRSWLKWLAAQLDPALTIAVEREALSAPETAPGSSAMSDLMERLRGRPDRSAESQGRPGSV